jgi:hypothetical protein
VEAKYGYHPGTNIPRKRPESAFDGRGVCKHCGETGLVWERQSHGWVLVRVGGRPHMCVRGAR